MRNANALCRTVAAASLALIATACSRPGGAAAAPQGETDLSCAALIFAANHLVDDGKVADADGTIKSKYIAAMSGYLTEHAKAKGLDTDAAMAAMKIEAYRMMGMVAPKDRKVPDDKIAERAKKCIAP
jgi:hypothetical protein